LDQILFSIYWKKRKIQYKKWMDFKGFSAGKARIGHSNTAARLAFDKKMDGDFGEDLEQYPG
jgi:hypothetical protein